MRDAFGREIRYLRVSITTRCNLRCVYCGKESCEKRDEELTPEALEKIVRAFARTGVERVRVTGGEPLVRPDVCEIVRRVAGAGGFSRVSLTTNGVLLGQYAKELKDAGLTDVNVSLDSTDENVYRLLTGTDALGRVLDGIAEAEKAGLPVKINAVLMRGVNDDGAGALIELARTRRIDVRFIELMPFSDAGEDKARVVTNDELRKRFSFLRPLGVRDGTAELYTADGFRGRVGFISPISHRFCHACNRMRLLSDGRVKLCLGDETTVDLRPLVGKREELLRAVRSCIRNKPAGHRFGEQAQPHGLNRTGG